MQPRSLPALPLSRFRTARFAAAGCPARFPADTARLLPGLPPAAFAFLRFGVSTNELPLSGLNYATIENTANNDGCDGP